MKKYLFLTAALYSLGAQANLITNPGFENGFTGWQTSGDAAIRSVDPLAFEGTKYIYGQNTQTGVPGTETFKVWQEVDLFANGFSAVDVAAGNLSINFGGWQAGWGPTSHNPDHPEVPPGESDGDSGIISVRLLGTDGLQIGSTISLNPFTSLLTWEKQSGTAALLAGTQYISYEFAGTIQHGSNTDAYLDAAFLNVVVVPVPAAVWLFGSGLIGLVGVARRKAYT